ncbi:MAG: DUF1273 domain-containing protein [Oscillospiraceae bacterium]|jgi:uncharacterized phage-like protein YoqJ|nr:DUF1273 domain-containing protein [Oscillospiraceae bacterium]
MTRLLRERTACFTGHRTVPAQVAARLAEHLEKQIEFLYEKGITDYLAGGAKGFDALAAATVLKLRDTSLPDIRLILTLPCPDQYKTWGELDIALHQEIRRRADGIITLSDEYYDGCMLVRNRYMVDNSLVCVAYYNGTRNGGGTYHTAAYCRHQGVLLVNLYETLNGTADF